MFAGYLSPASKKNKKFIEHDTDWKSSPIPPRHAPIYAKSKPINSRWQWRSIKLRDSLDQEFICLMQISPDFGKWNAWLMKPSIKGGWTVLVRLEDQPRQSGLHIHADCNAEPPSGPQSVSLPNRLPEHRRHHRRQIAWTRETFYKHACEFFGIIDLNPQPDLFA